MFLDTLSRFIQEHREYLEDWLFILLLKLLQRAGTDMLSSVLFKLQMVLEHVRWVLGGWGVQMGAQPVGVHSQWGCRWVHSQWFGGAGGCTASGSAGGCTASGHVVGRCPHWLCRWVHSHWACGGALSGGAESSQH